MDLKRKYYKYLNYKNRLISRLHDFFEDLSFYVGGFVFFVIVYDLGFPHTVSYFYFSAIYLLFLVSFSIAFAFRSLLFPSPSQRQNTIRWLIVVGLMFFCSYKYSKLKYQPDFHSLSYYGSLAICGLLLLFDVSRKILLLYSKRFNPALSFVLSFALLALVGSGLLMLPRATVHGISFVDALFMSVSAVCVTGLATVDMAVEFTRLGKLILLVLVQLGGLGMLSFTSFFGYLYQGSFSIENQLFLKDFATSERIGDVFKTLSQIIMITFGLELMGAVLIYLTINDSLFQTSGQQMRFAIFHSVSAFCNAGFSITPNGLFNHEINQSYGFQWIVALLIILGSIGFFIITDFYAYLRHYTKQLYFWGRFQLPIQHLPRIVSINSLMVLLTTGCLLLVGMVAILLIEQKGILAYHPTWWGKITTAFFASVTPRSGGYNTFDMGLLQPATVLIFLLLMWIGGSPGSTGGGIKTTTFAVAMLNIVSLAKGKDRVEFAGRRIPSESVRRAFTVITLSLLVIGPAILIITILEPNQSLIGVAFECFSAFCTVGLSLNLTPTFTDTTKVVLIVLMFVGRVGTFTLLVAFVKRVKTMNYQYPNENVFIN